MIRGEEKMGQVLRIEASAGAEPLLGLEFSGDMTFAQWEAEGRRLSQMSHAVQWYIGDWWNAGFRYGEERREDTAKRLFGLDYGTVRNLGSIASRIGLSRRRDNVPFSYHVEVASLSDPTVADALLDRADELTVRDLRREVQAIKAVNDPEASATEPEQPFAKAPPQPAVRNELTEAYGRYVEAMEALETFRKLTRREADFLSFALDKLGEAHAERRPVPDDFDIVFVEQGRIACETWYRASRITVNRWLLQRGKQKLIEERSQFVKHQRSIAHDVSQVEPASPPAADPFMPVARMAAEYLRVSRYGGWVVSMCETGGWRVGTVYRSSEELIAMAERQGFDRQAAVTEAREEGY